MSPEPFSYLLFVIASIFFEIFDVFIGQRKLRLLLCPLESFSSWDVSQFKLQLLQHFEKENCQCCVKELSTWNTLLLLGQHHCLPLLGNWHWLNLDLDYEKVTQEDCDQINLFNYLRWNEFEKKTFDMRWFMITIMIFTFLRWKPYVRCVPCCFGGSMRGTGSRPQCSVPKCSLPPGRRYF